MKKKYIDFPYMSLVGLVCLVISLFIVFCSIPDSKSEYLNFEKTIENIELKEETLHFDFVDDETKYIFYEYDDITFEDFNNLSVGDNVVVFVDKDYQDFKYAVIYKMIFNDQVIFDSIEYYHHHDISVVNVFAPTSIILLLTYLFIFIFSIKAKGVENTNEQKIDFIIKNPYSQVATGVVFGVFGLVPFICFLIQYMLELISIDLFNFAYVFLIFIVLGILLILVSVIECFKLENERYTYQHLLRKQSISIEEIDRVEIYLKNLISLCEITFYNIDGKKVIVFRDNGLVFAKGYLIRSLKHHKIKYLYKTKTGEIYK